MTATATGLELKQWRAWAIQLAASNDIDPYEVDWLLQGLTPLTGTTLKLESYVNQTAIPLKAPLIELTAKWNQRISDRTPVQYLVGETPWRNFTLTVTPDVLIPRPETELITDIVTTLVQESPVQASAQTGHWADVGTGSGAIALSLAHTFAQATVHAIDISAAALAVAQKNVQRNVQKNAQKNNLAHSIQFHTGSWLSPLATLKGQLAGIVSNPPYIPSQTVLTLQAEVTHHEPHLALDGGADGLDCIKTLISTSADYLMPQGIWLTELMDGQAATVANLLQAEGNYTHITIHPDLSNKDRFVSARKAL